MPCHGNHITLELIVQIGKIILYAVIHFNRVPVRNENQLQDLCMQS